MNMLFLCTHNACRSILAEAIFRHVAVALGIKTQIYTAGSAPRGQVHPLTLQYLTDWHIKTAGLASKRWDDFIRRCALLRHGVCLEPAHQRRCQLHAGRDAGDVIAGRFCQPQPPLVSI